jgi:DNA-binding MarR family transcriptional regulator
MPPLVGGILRVRPRGSARNRTRPGLLASAGPARTGMATRLGRMAHTANGHSSGESDTRAAAWRAFLEAHARVTARLERELRDEQGLPLTWYDVLVQLHEADGHQLRMQELADAVLLSKSGLTRLVDRMERAGLVRRAACPSDRRGTFAELTAEGLRTLRRTAPTHLRGVGEHFSQHLDETEAEVLAQALRRIAHLADGGSEPSGSVTRGDVPTDSVAATSAL